MHFLQAINSDLSVLRDCNKTGGTIKGDIKIYIYIYIPFIVSLICHVKIRHPQLQCTGTKQAKRILYIVTKYSFVKLIRVKDVTY